MTLVGKAVGRYRIETELGRGGMGVVYRAEDTALRRTVALKVLPAQLVNDPERRRRLLREARSAAAATHAHIAAVYDVGEDGDTVFVAMELVRGKSLRRHLDDHPEGLPLAEVGRIGGAIARGLAKAHAEGVIHRDLKPDNVMIGDEGEVKILDFGLAKLREPDDDAALDAAVSTASVFHTEEGRVMGTPSYMSPEQAKGRAVDQRSDLFALGVMLYEIATARRPFDRPTTVEVLIAIDRDEPEPPSGLRPSIPSALDALVMRCLRKEPAERFHTGSEVATALDAALAGGSAARPRSRARLAALAGVAAMFALGVAAWLRRGDQPGAPAKLPPSPLTAPNAKLACPPLRASGVPEPAGWLGAAAASMVCRRAVPLLGGDSERSYAPAALLDLPHELSDAFPPNPYDASDMRDRAVAAARARAAAYVDGDVAYADATFAVHLVLRDASDRALAEGTGSGARIHRAIQEAMAPLVGPATLPKAAAINPAVAKWSGIADVDLACLLEDWALDWADGTAERDALEARRADLGSIWISIAVNDANMRSEPRPSIDLPPLDRSSPPAFARSAVAAALADPKADWRALADELRALRSKEPDLASRRWLAAAETSVALRGSDAGRIQEPGLWLVKEAPRWPSAPGTIPTNFGTWDALGGSFFRRVGHESHARAYTAWYPDEPDAWNNRSHFGLDAAAQIALSRRAVLLAPRNPLFVGNLVSRLLEHGEREEARGLGSELLAGNAVQRLRGELILAQVDASYAAFGRVLERAQRAFASLAEFGMLARGEVVFLYLALDVSMLVGRAPEIADAFVARFVEADPPRLYPGHTAVHGLAAACALASEAVSARCFARVRALIAAGFFVEGVSGPALVLDAAEKYATGDAKAAAALLRPQINAESFGFLLAPTIFERAGEPTLVERVDEKSLARSGRYNGADPAHLRAARRAAAAGDHPRAADLARRVIRAWETADVDVPAVAEMKVLLEKR